MTIFIIFQKTGASNTNEGIISRTNGINAAPFDIYNSWRIQNNNIIYPTASNNNFNIQTATGLNLYSFTVTSGLWSEYINGVDIFNENICCIWNGYITKSYNLIFF